MYCIKIVTPWDKVGQSVKKDFFKIYWYYISINCFLSILTKIKQKQNKEEENHQSNNNKQWIKKEKMNKTHKQNNKIK